MFIDLITKGWRFLADSVRSPDHRQMTCVHISALLSFVMWLWASYLFFRSQFTNLLKLLVLSKMYSVEHQYYEIFLGGVESSIKIGDDLNSILKVQWSPTTRELLNFILLSSVCYLTIEILLRLTPNQMDIPWEISGLERLWVFCLVSFFPPLAWIWYSK